MILRKINSYFSLIAAVLFVIHAGLMCLLMNGAIDYRPEYHIVGNLLYMLFVGHSALSMFIFFMNMEEKKTEKSYWKNNKATATQRMLAILMLFMAFVHMQTGTKMWAFQIVYIAVASGHIGLSVPRAMLTVGAVGSESVYKKLQLISVILGIGIILWSAISYGCYALLRN